jgi:hypothetical protein
MNSPVYEIKMSSSDSHQTSPSWMVCFVRNSEVSISSSLPSFQNASQRGSFKNDFIVTKNDCVSINITNSKSSPSKNCSLGMKVTDINYQNAIAAGDWVFVWINNNEEKINELYDILSGSKFENFKTLTDVGSGLKFFGRVLSVSSSTNISSNGIKTVFQTINCQSFLELMSSIYFAYTLTSLASLKNTQENIAFDLRKQTIFKNASDDFFNTVAVGNGIIGRPIDLVTSDFLLFLLGYPNFLGETQISFSEPIKLPNFVCQVLGRENAKEVWEIYSIISGIQKYKSGIANNSTDLMVPENITKGSNNVLYLTDTRTLTEYTFQRPPIWTNETLWNVLSQFHDSMVNEMFSSLRINPEGQIGPVFTVREKPFSTGLINFIEKGSLQIGINSSPIQKNTSISSSNPFNNENDQKINNQLDESLTKKRTMFYNLPRWKMPLSMVKNLNTYTSDGDRINFVQVWGRNGSDLASSLNPESKISSSITNYNFVEDRKDIQKNGLRADVSVTNFPLLLQTNVNFYTVCAKKRADWLFNGHLKLSGTVSCFGIQDPIAEGDNIEIDGVLYHIESVNHNCSISPGGIKTFSTNIQLTNGLISRFLNDSQPPIYPLQLGLTPEQNNISFNNNETISSKFIKENPGTIIQDNAILRIDEE